MKSSYRKFLWPALGVVVVLSLLWEFLPLRDASARLDALPKQGSFFISREVPFTEVETGIYEKARAIKRLYQVKGQVVLAVVIDGSRNRHAVHDPTFCFRGAGWTIEGSRNVEIPGGTACLLSLAKGNQKAEAMYWWSDGRTRHATSTRYFWQTTLRRLTFGNSGEEPVLVILQPGTATPLNWNSVLQQMPIFFEL